MLLFLRLCLVPQLVHLGKRQILDLPPGFISLGLNVVESPDKLLVCMFKRIVGIELV